MRLFTERIGNSNIGMYECNVPLRSIFETLLGSFTLARRPLNKFTEKCCNKHRVQRVVTFVTYIVIVCLSIE